MRKTERGPKNGKEEYTNRGTTGEVSEKRRGKEEGAIFTEKDKADDKRRKESRKNNDMSEI